MAGDQKNNNSIEQNIIIGEKAIIFLYHKQNKDVLLDEIQRHAQSGRFIQILEDVANKGVEATGLKTKRDTHSKGQGKNPVYEWSKQTNGGPRLYLDVSSHNGKFVYIIYLVGDKQSQDTDFAKAYNRRVQIQREGIDVHAEIEKTQASIQNDGNNGDYIKPKVVAHHYGQYTQQTKQKKHQKQRAG